MSVNERPMYLLLQQISARPLLHSTMLQSESCRLPNRYRRHSRLNPRLLNTEPACARTTFYAHIPVRSPSAILPQLAFPLCHHCSL